MPMKRTADDRVTWIEAVAELVAAAVAANHPHKTENAKEKIAKMVRAIEQQPPQRRHVIAHAKHHCYRCPKTQLCTTQAPQKSAQWKIALFHVAVHFSRAKKKISPQYGLLCGRECVSSAR